MQDKVDSLAATAAQAVSAAQTQADLKRLHTEFLGRKGEITALLKGLGTLPKEARPAAGQAVNKLKNIVQELIDKRLAQVKARDQEERLKVRSLDPTEPGNRPDSGSLHPLTTVREELEDIFSSMGYMVLDGPDVELEYYNFEALNIPSDHPARDMQDTFWVEDGLVLRTHTSPVQIRAMEKFKPPIRAIVPGRCFRQEDVDASHEHTFYQMEGLVVDKDISVSHLIDSMKICLGEILHRDVEIRLRPGYFPFVEPGFELDANCPFCAGTGKQKGQKCPVCKASGWIELLPCGMVHPNVLRSGGIDPEEYTGFAFGLGLQRLVMVRYGIDDIRTFMGGDLRFLEQF